MINRIIGRTNRLVKSALRTAYALGLAPHHVSVAASQFRKNEIP